MSICMITEVSRIQSYKATTNIKKAFLLYFSIKSYRTHGEIIATISAMAVMKSKTLPVWSRDAEVKWKVPKNR